MKRTLSTAAIAAAAFLTCLAQAPGRAAEVAAPQVFAPGVISGPADDADPAFTPDGATLVLARDGTLMISRRGSQGWSAPRIAPFSGEWRDQQPAMSPDGRSLVFVSNRPVEAGAATHPTGNLWRVDRHGDGWGAPVHLPEQVNRDGSVWAPSIAGDGSLWFIARAESKAPLRLWRSQWRDGGYLAAVPVSFGDPTTQDVDPAVAPDESFIVFGSMHPGPDAHERLFIAFRAGAGWTTPVDLGDAVNGRGGHDSNEARLGPDGRTLYFASDRVLPAHFPRSRAQAEDDIARAAAWNNGSQNVWSVSLAPWLDARRGG
jgi:Tol biopolymer transport system component